MLPALPSQWANGNVKGARVRRGITVDIEWKDEKPTSVTLTADEGADATPVEVVYAGEVISSFTTTPGESTVLSDF